MMFFLFKPQLFNLLNRLAKFEFGDTKNIQYTDQDSEPESPISSLPILTREKFAVRIVIFIVLSYLIYIVPAYLSRILVEFGNSEYSTGNEKIGTASYNLTLELNNEFKKAINKCYFDN